MIQPKVLIVDDKPQNIHAVELLLQKLDVDSVSTTSGIDALQLTLEHDFCVAIIDIQMPEMDGYELVTLLRGNQSTAHLPIIFVSAIYSDEYHHHKAYDTGAVDFLSKPLIPDVFLSKVKVFIDLYLQRQQLQATVNQLQESNRILAETQARLIRQEKLTALGKLSGMLGHELRNPLAVIANAVYFLNLKLSHTDLTVAEYLVTIEQQIQEANRIITDFLNLSQNKADNQFYTDIASLIDKVLSEESITNETITVTRRVPSNLPHVFIDPQQIEQALGNLIRNAYQAMPHGGHLTIQVTVVDETMHIDVIDTGTGMSEEIKEKIFEPLFSTKIRGLGLGLIIAQNLIEINGGVITVESKEGVGSQFHVTLPLQADYAKLYGTSSLLLTQLSNTSVT